MLNVIMQHGGHATQGSSAQTSSRVNQCDEPVGQRCGLLRRVCLA